MARRSSRAARASLTRFVVLMFLSTCVGVLTLSDSGHRLKGRHLRAKGRRGAGSYPRGIGVAELGEVKADDVRRQGYRVSLREIDAWVASFRHDPMISDDGFGSPWGAVQRAAWQVKRSA